MTLPIDNLLVENLLDYKSERSQVGAVTVANSTQTLLVTSETVQYYTGSVTGQVVKMPDATTLTVGFRYLLINDSSINIAVQNNSSGAIVTLAAGERLYLICMGVGSAAGTWAYSTFQNTPHGTQFYTWYPGTGLAVNYTGGNYRINGTLTAVAGGSITLPTSTTGTIYVDVDGVVKATASIPNGATPLYSFTTNGSAVTALADVREEVENNMTWGVSGDIITTITGQSKSAGTLEKYARADHVHGNGGLFYKAGVVAGGSFSGNPKTATVTFGTAMASATYAVIITGQDVRSFSYSSRTTAGFTISANANATLANDVSWIAMAEGEAT